MRSQNLPLAAAVAALALAGASIASRFEAEMATVDLAAQQAVSHDSRRANALGVLAGITAVDPSPNARTSSPDLGLTDGALYGTLGVDTNHATDFDTPSLATTTTTAPAITTPTTTAPPVPSTTTAPETTSPETTVLAPAAAELDWDNATIGDRGLEALALVSYPWEERLPGWEIRFHEGREGAYGYTLTQESVIDIYVREGQSKQLLAHVIAHELGHAVDVSLNSGDDRRRWQVARGIEDAPWWPDNRASDFSTGAGDFAESFAAWQVGTESYRSRLADPPSGNQQQILAELAAG